MKTLIRAAAAALALLTVGAAHAADMRLPVYKAPPPPIPVYSWTGCYLAGGGGYGVYNEELTLSTVTALPGIPAGVTFVDGFTQGGRGWLATAQTGCDYQFGGATAGNWVIGAFIDGDLTDIHGRHTGGNVNIGLQYGDEKLRDAWAAGGRLGWLATPQFLIYASGGFTEASFGAVNYLNGVFPNFGAPNGLQLPGRTYRGFFVGGGAEYALGFLPGLFWKTEYRFADYGSRTDTVLCTSAALCGVAGPTAFAEQNHPYVQTVRTELVWRFNWNGH